MRYTLSLIACFVGFLSFSQTQMGADIDGINGGNFSGGAISMPDSSTIAISGTTTMGWGYIRVYKFNGSTWNLRGADIFGEVLNDGSGFSVSMPDSNVVAIGAIDNNGNGTSSGHVRIYEWDGTSWVQKGLDIDGEASGDKSGYSVSMPDANTVAIGAPLNSGNGTNSGHVRIYEWDGTSWVQKGVDIDGEATGDQFGHSVSMPDVNTIAIGAIKNDGTDVDAGHVRIYEWNGSTWIQKGLDIDGESAGDQSGFAISMPNNTTIAIGAPSNNENGSQAGHVRVFEWNGTSWTQKGLDIDGSGGGFLGYAISMSDANTFAVGAPYSNGNGTISGQIRVYEWNGNNWLQKTIINGEAAGDISGRSISMANSNTVGIGATDNDGNGTSSGHVRIYSLDCLSTSEDVKIACNSFTWIDGKTYTASNHTAAYIYASPSGCDSTIVLNLTILGPFKIGSSIYGEAAGDNSGSFVSMPDANTIAIGAEYNNGSQSVVDFEGHVRVYRRSGNSWVQKGADIEGEDGMDRSGFSVSMPDANTVAIGTPFNGGNGTESGHVRIYRWSGSTWLQKGADIDGEAAEDHSGFSVSMPDVNTVAIGAGSNDGNGNNAGHVRIYEWNGSAWIQKGTDIDGEAANDYSGCSVSMPDVNTIAIGAKGNGNNAGHVRIYEWNGSTWIQKGTDIDGEATGDYSGCSVSMPDVNTVAIGAEDNDGNGNNAGHVRIYEWNGSAWIQKGIDIDGETSGDSFGYSVSMPDASTVAIGAPGNSQNELSSGQVSHYKWIGNAWKLHAQINGEDAHDNLGICVSMPDNNTLAVSTPGDDGNSNYFSGIGSTNIYSFSTGSIESVQTTCDSYTWIDGNTYTSANNTATYTLPNAGGCDSIVTLNLTFVGSSQIGIDLDGSNSNDNFGKSVSMPDDNTVAVGAPLNDVNGMNSGSVGIYSWNGTTWTQKGINIYGENTGDQFGFSVSMPNANTIAIGALGNDGNGNASGHVRIYEWNGSTWTQKGVDIDGEAAGDRSGFSVSMPDANTVAIGADENDGNGNNSGHVRIYKWTGITWIQKGADIDGEAIDDQSGCSVSMPDANTVAIGASLNDGNGNNSGHVRIYEWNGSTWVQKGGDIDGEVFFNKSGFAVSMPDAGTVAIGAPLNFGNGTEAGHVRVFEWNGTSWAQKGLDIDGEAAGDQSGFSVSMPSNNIVAIGAPYNAGNGSNSGHVRIFEWIGSSWVQKGTDIDGEASNNNSGNSVSMPTANTIAIGALLNYGNGANSGHTRVHLLAQSNITDVQMACGSYTWIDGNTYTTSNNTATFVNTNTLGCNITTTLDLTINHPTTGIDTQTSCLPFTWIDGNTYYTSNNTATHTILGGAVSGCDSIVTLDLTISSSSYGTDVISTCAPYIWIDGNTYYTSNNTATHTILGGAAGGCDSIVTLDLTINNLDTNISISDTTATALEPNATYQWLDCNNGLSPITGETLQSFSTSISGDYAVEISSNGCIDTSSCVHLQYCNLQSNFTKVDLGNGLYEFTDHSSGEFNTILWNFGDGTMLLNQNVVQHTFLVNGPMSSSLIVKDTNYLPIGACSDLSYQAYIISGITSPSDCEAGFIIISDTTTNNITIIDNSAGTNLIYSWDFGDGNSSNQATPSHTYSTAGPFNLCLSIDDQNGCTDTFCDSINRYGSIMRQSGFTINIISSGIITEHEILENNKINLFPNPADSHIYLDHYPSDITEVKIVSEIGQIVKVVKTLENGKLDVSQLAPGQYFVIIKSSEGRSYSRFIKL